MKNTLENKVKFFAQYWGQDILNHPEQYPTTLKDVVEGIYAGYLIDDYENSFLELKPLSSITDEDAHMLARLYWRSWVEPRYTDDPPAYWHDTIHGFEFHGYSGVYTIFSWKINSNSDVRVTMMIEDDCRISIVKGGETGSLEALTMYDYLRSKGYALPWMGLTVDELVEYGWIKIKTIDQ